MFSSQTSPLEHAVSWTNFTSYYEITKNSPQGLEVNCPLKMERIDFLACWFCCPFSEHLS